MNTSVLFFFILSVIAYGQEELKINTGRFPDGFMFGIASSAYQIEGGWDADGKGESNWDRFTHVRPDKIGDKSNGDIACNSYAKYKEDVLLLKNLGVNFYRFSLSWSRILPTGFSNKINKPGIDYYNNLIDELLVYNITPVVTLFHWDLPQYLQHLGGFTNPLIQEWFFDYANVCFKHFGNRVKIWSTFNEPRQICLSGYAEGRSAPGLESTGVGDYICSHNLLKAHARVYHLYNNTFKEAQKGKIGIVIECPWVEPVSEAKEDFEAAERARQFLYGWYANPIFSSNGDYPIQMIDFIANRSNEEGFPSSRLPKFTTQEINFIKGTSDYFGLNHYSSLMAQHKTKDPIGDPSYAKDSQVNISTNHNWIGIKSFRIVPWGFRSILKWIKNNYQDPEIYVTENGFPDQDYIHDQERIKYHTGYLSNLLDAINTDNVKVKLYTAWSLLDLFEWGNGYTIGFGLHHVNFSDPIRPRTAKDSAEFYKNVIANRQLPVA